MKRFKFNLESVLKYRESVERYERGILSGLNAQLVLFLDELARLQSDYMAESAEFEKMSKNGMTVAQIISKHAILENIELFIEKKLEEIEEHRKLITKQTNVVVKAKRDTKTMDKLKEAKYGEYVKSENKATELFIEEFVAHRALVKNQ